MPYNAAMYQQHFGLNELPFSIAPDPRYLYMSERHREALAHLLFGLKSNGAFILLTGDVGTGKTTVSRCLLEQTPAKTRLALILNPMMSALELLQAICDELHISRPIQNSSIKVHVDCISRDLLAAHARGKDTVVLIDEAQNLAGDVLEQLRMLTNLETAERKLLQIILLGQPELRDQLARPEMSQLSQRITARYHLSPLNLVETRAYVQHRLLVAGCRDALFMDASIKRLHQLSNGVPRLINVICDRALLGAYVQNKARVSVTVMEHAAAEIFGVASVGRKKYRGLIAVISVVVIALITVILLNLELSPVTAANTVSTMAMTSDSTSAPIEKKIVQSVVREAVLTPDIIWPDAEHSLRSNILAFQSLFALWQLTYKPEESGTPCYFAQLHALDCLNENGDLEILRAYNRPVILKLYDQRGDAQYAALLAVEDQSVTIDLAGNTQTIAATLLQKYWRGEFTMLWQQPPGYKGLMQIGVVGDEVLWLRQKLNKIDPKNPLDEINQYDEQLAQRVRAFQRKQGLLSDGVAGVQTLIHINESSGSKEPRLMRRAEGPI